MPAIYRNFLAGTTTDNPLTSGATVVNSSALAQLPIVTAPDTMWLTLDPNGVHGAPEVVLVTQHLSGATQVTVTRAQQGTTARSHPSGTVWHHSTTRADLDELPFRKVTTKGDILVATGAQAVARVAVGADGVPLVGRAADAAGVAFGQITEAGIATNAVTADKIAPDAVGSSEIASNAVGSDEIAANAVGTSEIAGGAVTNPKVNFTWAPYTPVVTAGSLGNGTIEGSWCELGDLIFVRIEVTIGSTSSAMTNGFDVSLPVDADTTVITGANAQKWTGSIGANEFVPARISAPGRIALLDNTGGAAGDQIYITAFYEKA